MANSQPVADLDQIWTWLSNVPDPEVPVLSVLDLGIVRSVERVGEELVVSITPTYTGCPALNTMAFDIEAELVKRGEEKVRVVTQLSPPWTTDWIGPEAREKLRAYGIAPPAKNAPCIGAVVAEQADAPVACPQCGSTNTVRVSQFGSTPCKAAYSCSSCSEPFDYFKPF